MSQEQTLVKVAYRGITLMESAVIQDLTEHGGFLQTDRPLPVGTALFILPVNRPELAVGMTVSGVVEKRKAKRGTNKSQPGMLLSFQGSSDEFFASLEGFEEDENSFEMDAEPPDGSEDEEPEQRDRVSTGDFVFEGEAPDRTTATYGVIDDEDEDEDEEPPEIPDEEEEEEPENRE